MDGKTLKCAQCGKVLSGEENYCPRCKNPISRICSGCGRELGPEVNFCPHCGEKSGAGNDPQDQPGVSAPDQVFSPYMSSPNVNLVSPNGRPYPDIVPAGTPAPPFAQPSAISTIQINPGEELLGGRFVVKELLGFGGFGSVYLSKDKEMDEDLALKVVFTELAQAHMAVDQLKFEFKARKEIRDRKHILEAELPLRDEFKGVSLILLPMEYAEGGSFRNWMRANPAVYEEDEETAKRKKQALEYFKQACRGVQAIHEAGLVHLDLKPENLLIQKKTIKVADFGLSRDLLQLRVANPELMRDGVGTPVYMSPEQVRSARQKDVNKLSDIYSLGIILFELLDGNVPFEGNLDELKKKHLTYKPPSLDGLLAPWGRIVNRCLAKEPSKRYPSVNELLADLDRCDRGDILSVDIACNNCGHINANKDLKKCQKCGENINHLFRRCPNCRRLNRLDVETCADCNFEIGRHFRVLDLLKEANELRDVDPDKAMRLLLEVLKLEGGNREAKEMLASLRRIQEQIEEIIPEAEKAQKEGRLEDARGKWQDILSLAPRHVVATGKKKELDELIERYNANYDRSFVLMNQGKFPQARQLLNECREMIPTRKETDEALRNLNKREKSYNQHFEKANSLKRRKNLNSARKEFELCLGEAPKNEEALKLKAKVDKDIRKAGELFSEAKNLLKMAEFESVGRNIVGIQEIQNDLAGFQKFVKAVEEKKNEYHDLPSKWRKALEPEVRDLNKAQGYLEAGLKICPECSEATKLLNRVIRDKEQAKQLIEDAKLNIKAANFSKAKSEIVQAEGIWPKVLQLSQTKETLKTTQQNYNTHFNAARELYEKKKDLDPAFEQVKTALKICTESSKAKSLEKKIIEDRETATSLLQEAKSCISRADFDNASENIKTAKGIWPNVPNISNSKNELETKEKKYNIFYDKAKKLFDKGKKLNVALENARFALEVCPKSYAATSLIMDITDRLVKQKEDIKTKRHFFIGISVLLTISIGFAISFVWMATKQEKETEAQRTQLSPLAKGKLYVDTKPRGARIRILNIKPKYRPGIELGSGSYHMEVSAIGYGTKMKWVWLAAGEHKRISIQLTRIPASQKKERLKTFYTGKIVRWVFEGSGNFIQCYEFEADSGKRFSFLINPKRVNGPAKLSPGDRIKLYLNPGGDATFATKIVRIR